VTGAGHTVEAMPIDRLRAVLAKHGRTAPQGSAAER
jgi:hypothetical protein